MVILRVDLMKTLIPLRLSTQRLKMKLLLKDFRFFLFQSLLLLVCFCNFSFVYRNLQASVLPANGSLPLSFYTVKATFFESLDRDKDFGWLHAYICSY